MNEMLLCVYTSYITLNAFQKLNLKSKTKKINKINSD